MQPKHVQHILIAIWEFNSYLIAIWEHPPSL